LCECLEGGGLVLLKKGAAGEFLTAVAYVLFSNGTFLSSFFGSCIIDSLEALLF
jgi:hypothetical protein